MNKQGQISSAPPAEGTQPATVARWDQVRLQLGLRIDRQTTLPGPVEITAAPDYRLLIHAGSPIRCSYRGRSVSYTRGDIDLFPAQVAEKWTADDSSAALLLQVAPALLQRTAAEIGRNPDHTGVELRCQFRDPQLEHLAWALDAERQAGYPNGHLYMDSIGLALTVHLLGGYAASMRALRGLSPQELQRVTEYIEASLDQALSVTELADVAGMSATHLKTLFKRSTGLPVYEYVIQRRVERAKMLLLQGKLPASQIALEAGFAHQSHMARTMRRVLGVTPTGLTRSVHAP
jgi:AraC family transcriptional regulator